MSKKLRLAIVGLFFVLLWLSFGTHAFYTFYEFTFGSTRGWYAKPDGRIQVVRLGTDENDFALRNGDELVAFNSEPYQHPIQLARAHRRVPPGTPYSVSVRREGELRHFTLTTEPQPLWHWLAFILITFLSGVFLVTGMAVFLLRPDDKQALLLALMLATAFVGRAELEILERWPLLAIPLVVTSIVAMLMPAFFLHFFLIFPENSPLLRRFPRAEWGIYVPYLLIVFPLAALFGYLLIVAPEQMLAIQRDYPGLVSLANIAVLSYILGGLVSLAVNYRQANALSRRKLRVILAGTLAGVVPPVMLIALFNLLEPQLSFFWLALILCAVSLFLLVPLSFAYAILRHQVIPVRLIIRRGVRYLLVSRGFILFETAVAFALLSFLLLSGRFPFIERLGMSGRIVVAIIATILVVELLRAVNRRVMPAIDRRFFREAYDAQQILSELVEAARTIPNVRHLLEMVVTKLQLALRTENVVVFLRAEATGAYPCALSSEYHEDLHSSISSQPALVLPREAFILKRLSAAGRPLEVDWTDPHSWLAEIERMKDGNDGATPPEATRQDKGAAQAAEGDLLRQINSALLLPLATKEELLGLVSLGPRLGDLPFSREDQRLLMSAAGQLTFALENARLVEQRLAEERRRQEIEDAHRRKSDELAFARQLQLSMLPKSDLLLDNVEIIGHMRPASEVGGDYYDFIRLDEHRYCLALGDATGHGIGAGLVVGMVKMALVNAAQREGANFNAPQFISDLNASLKAALSQRGLIGMCLSLTVFDTRTLTAEICSTGLPYPLLRRQETGRVELYELPGPPLGYLKRIKPQSRTLRLAPGDSLVLMSDGFHERMNKQDESWGYDTVSAEVGRICAGAASAATIARCLITSCDEFAGERENDDDMTVIVLRVKSSGLPAELETVEFVELDASRMEVIV